MTSNTPLIIFICINIAFSTYREAKLRKTNQAEARIFQLESVIAEQQSVVDELLKSEA